MEVTVKIQPDELKAAIIREIKEKVGLEVVPAESALHVKFDDVTKSVSLATLTVKKE